MLADNGVAGSFQPHLSAYNTHPSAPPAVAPVQQQDPPAAFTQEQAQATLDLAEVAAEFEEMFEELASAPDQAPAAIQGSVIQGVPILGQQAAAAAAAVSAQLAPEAPLGSARWTQAVLERVSSLRAEISPDAQAGPGGTQQQPGAPLRNSSLLRLRSLRSLVEDGAFGVPGPALLLPPALLTIRSHRLLPPASPPQLRPAAAPPLPTPRPPRRSAQIRSRPSCTASSTGRTA